MPRDQNGNYTLPAGNPVISGTTIDTSWANPTMQDLANEMTQSLSRTGEGGMLVPFENVDGAVATPGITWTNETVSGFYRAASGDTRVSIGGVDIFRWTASSVQIWDSVNLVWLDVLRDGDLPPGGVESFNTRVGHVLPEPGDYIASQVTYDNLASGLTAVDVQAAIDEVSLSVDVIDGSYVRSFNSRVGTVLPVSGDYFAIDIPTAPFSTLTATEVQGALEELEALIEFVGSGIILKGSWDALANVPDLLTEPKVSGNYWIVSVAGTTPLPDGDGGFISSWAIGDRAIYINQVTPTVFDGWAKITSPDTLPATNITFDSSIYDDFFLAPFPTTVQEALDAGWPLLALAETSVQPGDNVSDLVNDAGYLIAASAVTSFKTRIGAVVPLLGDYPASIISYTNTSSGLAATQVQAAIDELDAAIENLPPSGVTTFNTRTGAVVSVAGDYFAVQVIYDPSGSSLIATEAQGAIDELDGNVTSGDAALSGRITTIESSYLTTFNGRTGAVLPVINDYDADIVTFDNATSSRWGTTTQAALDDAYLDIEFLAGAVVLRGVWDALNNVPDLLVIGKVSGNYWIINVEGSTVLPLFPGAPAIVLPWEVNDRVLYLDDGVDTGFVQLRPEASEFLLLTGGTMLGAIIGVAPVGVGDLTRKDYVDTKLPLAGGTVTGQIVGIAPLAVGDLTRKDYVDNAIGNIPLGDYLPLTGGTLTGDANVLTIKEANALGGGYTRFTDVGGNNIGNCGLNTVGNIEVIAYATDLDLISTDAINLTAPIINAVGNLIVTGDGDVSGDLSSLSMIRAGGWWNTPDGVDSGMAAEVGYDHVGGAAQFSAYDRVNTVYGKVILGATGNPETVVTSGTVINITAPTINTTGAVVINGNSSTLSLQSGAPDAFGAANNMTFDFTGGRYGYIGAASSTSSDFLIQSDVAHLNLNGKNGNVNITAAGDINLASNTNITGQTDITGRTFIKSDFNGLVQRAVAGDVPVYHEFLRADGAQYGYVGKGAAQDFEAAMYLSSSTGAVIVESPYFIHLNAPVVQINGVGLNPVQSGTVSIATSSSLTVTLASPFALATDYVVATSYDINSGGSTSDSYGAYVTKLSGSQFSIQNHTGGTATVGWIATARTQ
jgi:hypothetical protein